MDKIKAFLSAHRGHLLGMLGAILVGVALFTVIRLRETDNGFIVDEHGDRSYAPDSFRLKVYIAAGDQELGNPLAKALLRWEDRGAYFEYVRVLDPGEPRPKSGLVVHLDPQDHPDDEDRLHGRTTFLWRGTHAEDDVLVGADVWIPEEVPEIHETLRALIIEHELGHAGLRLADDNLDGSLMNFSISTRIPRLLTSADLIRITQRYKR